MRKDIRINVDTQTDGISLSSRRLGISSENLQGKIIFTPKPFIDGICRMYIEGHGSVLMDKQEDCYTLDIKSSLLITPSIDVCFKITEPEKDNGVPIFATKIMHFEVLDTIESNEPIPEQYPQWKDVLDNYAEEKKGELDTYTTEMQTDLKAYKKDLEDEMSTTKDALTGEITATVTDETNKFNTNAESKTNAFNDNATEKTTNYNTNAETKIKEYNDNTTAKLEEYNTNATNKVNEFNNNVDSLENELTELASQMPWNTTEIQDSIHVEDSAKYSRNKLGLFGNLVQEKREGYNLIDTSSFINQTTNGMSFTRNSDGSILINGTSTDIISFQVKADFIIPAGDYTIYIPYSATYGLTVSFGYNGTIENTGVQPHQKTGANAYCKNITFMKDTSVNQLRFHIGSGTTYNNYLLKWMLVKGTYTADTIPPYEQYGAMPSIDYPSMPVVATGVQKISRLGKNHLNIANTEIPTDIGVSIKVENNKVILNGTATKNLSLIIANDLKLVLNGTYTFSQKVLSGSFSEGAYRIYLRDNTITDMFSSQLTFTSATQKMTNTFNATLTHLSIFINKGNIFNNYVIALQVEKGDITTSCEEPIEKETYELDLGTTELCKIVDENNNVVAQDKAVYKDGKWQWGKNVGKVVLDGTQTIETVASLDITTRVQYKNIVTSININTRANSSCNMLGYKVMWSEDKEGYYLDSATSGIILRIRKEFIGTTKESASEYFSNNNLVVYYPLLETTYEECTPAQSQVLDKLYKLSLQQGTNNIYVESENGVTTELQLTYMQDLMSQINELKQAMLNIGGN